MRLAPAVFAASRLPTPVARRRMNFFAFTLSQVDSGHAGRLGPAEGRVLFHASFPRCDADAAHACQDGEELVLPGRVDELPRVLFPAWLPGHGSGLVCPLECGLDVDAQFSGDRAHASEAIE